MANDNNSQNLIAIKCCSCGILFGLDKEVVALWRESKKNFKCPNNCVLGYNDKSPKEIELEELRAKVLFLQGKLESANKLIEDQKLKIDKLTLELEIWKPSKNE